MDQQKHGFNTRALHAGYREDPTTRATAVPIYQSSSFTFQDTQHAARLFSLEEEGHIYSRINNPTCEILERRLTSLEGGVGGLALSSGQAAIATTLFTLLKGGEEVLSSSRIYGGTHSLFQHTAERFNIHVRFTRGLAVEDFEEQYNKKTRMAFVETMGNPGLDIPHLKQLGAWTKEKGIPLVVDNTFASPYLCRPIEHGANIVVHSLTKYIGGHGTSIGGIIIDGGNCSWERFPTLTQPDPAYHGISFTEHFGSAAFIKRARLQILRDLGSCLSPFNAFLFLQGLESLGPRMDRHSENALSVARFLQEHQKVNWVRYPGLADHKDHQLAKIYLPQGCGGMMAFGVRGGLLAGGQFIEGLSLFSHLANVGDARSLAIHPASTTHHQLSPEDRVAAGVGDDLIRLSIGLEDVEDLIQDVDEALKKT